MKAIDPVAVADSESKDLKLSAIARVPLKDAVMQRVQDAIEQGELKSGDVITELGLAKKLGVAQPTIREALLELEFIGFVERTGVRKTRITVLTRRAIDDIYLVRCRLETLAVEIVTKNGNADLHVCWEQYRNMDAAAKEEAFPKLCRADLAFHRALWQASQNESLRSSLERLVPKLFAFGIIQHARPTKEKMIAIADVHRQLLEIIPTGDAEAAGSLMRSSMEQAWLDDVELPELG